MLSLPSGKGTHFMFECLAGAGEGLLVYDIGDSGVETPQKVENN